MNAPLMPDVKMSCVSFAPSMECLLAGDSDGRVSVFQLRGMITHDDEDQVHDPALTVLTHTVAMWVHP